MPRSAEELEKKFQKGVNQIQSGQVKKAESTLLGLLKDIPDNPSLIERIGYCYALQSKWSEAEQYYKKASNLSPGNSEILNNYGCILQKQNRWEEALPCFADAFQIAPENFSALSNLAQTLNHCGHKEDAIKYYEHALNLQPRNHSIRFQYAELLHNNGMLSQEAEQYKRLLTYEKDNIKARIKLALALFTMNKKQQAASIINETAYDRKEIVNSLVEWAKEAYQQGRKEDASSGYGLLTRLVPEEKSYWRSYAVNCYFSFGLEIALPVFTEAIEQFPEEADFFRILTIAYGQAGQQENAVAAARKAIELAPEDPKTHQYYAVVLRQLQKSSSPTPPADEVCASFVKAITLAMGNEVLIQKIAQSIVETKEADLMQQCLNTLPVIYQDSYISHLLGNYIELANNNYEAALEHAKQVITIPPVNSFALSEFAETCFYLEDYDTALQAAIKAVELDPQDSQALMRLGYLSVDCGKIDEGLIACERALSINPHDPSVRLAMGLIHLLKENWDAGWHYYEARFQMRYRHQIHIPPVEKWNGEANDDLEVIVICEQGLGDILQFSRFLTTTAERVGRTIFICNPLLHHLYQPLAEKMPDKIEVLLINDKFTVKQENARWTSLIELPRTLGLEPAEWCNNLPNIQATPEKKKIWQERLNLNPAKLNVGIAWQGSHGARIDVGRSIPLEQFEPLAGLENVQLYSLQKHYGSEQLDQVSFKDSIIYLGDDFDADTNAFADTAAVMENLDLVITTDTSIAHLAGALGVKTWVALKHTPDWRWGISGDETHWYTNMKLFRQSIPGQWDDVFERLEKELTEFAGQKLAEQS